ncbi:pyridoxamine 5'-phosphate oxidase family protein [Extibacter muris]|nr:pyridoxamine 5'-phosphate oxidase family protein [Extibacter muris]MCB6203584.1 pyridoxamine 5'-phosphate oxidase family protein [Extibacter muris]MCQ4665035.1 pyridoxamine 5'-phosphate oxidase family protein [Extibacter muris]MCQ4694401.1 pyridoxamine 5'-phosphate oxidase family protein [Extibacter muris]
MMRDPVQTIGNLIDKSNLNVVNYIDEEGYPVSRAMLAPRERDGIRTFWFTTNTSSNKVKRYRENAQASIYFVDKRFYRGVCLMGTMEVLETAEAKERIWRDGDTMYYEEGVTDPDYCVLKFTAVKGRYYSNFHSEDFGIQ